MKLLFATLLEILVSSCISKSSREKNIKKLCWTQAVKKGDLVRWMFATKGAFHYIALLDCHMLSCRGRGGDRVLPCDPSETSSSNDLVFCDNL